MSKELKIKNRYLIGLCSWLNSLSLSGRDSRCRTRFCTVLNRGIVNYNSEYSKLLDKYCSKDKEGNLLKKKVGNQEHFDLPSESIDKFRADVEELLDKEFLFSLDESHIREFGCVKNLVLDTDYRFGFDEKDSVEEKRAKTRQAEDYNVWCEWIESIDLDFSIK